MQFPVVGFKDIMKAKKRNFFSPYLTEEFPIWWDEASAMIATFLAENNFSGKTIIPFCTSSSDDIGNSLHIFSELCPDAEIAEGLTANDLNDIEPWIQGLGLMK